MTNSSESFWSLVDMGGGLMTEQDCDCLGEGRTWLRQNHILVETTPASVVVCPGCNLGHVETVMSVSLGQFAIRCPELLRVGIETRDLRRWTLAILPLVQRLATALALEGRVRQLDQGRVWRLGTTRFASAHREVLLVVSSSQSAASPLSSYVGPTGRPILLYTSMIPPQVSWDGHPPVCLSARSILTLTTNGFDVDDLMLTDTVSAADRERKVKQVAKRKQLVSQLRGTMRKVLNSTLSDEQIVAAHRQCGSTHKAAEDLTKRGYPIHHSTVARKVRAAKEAGTYFQDGDVTSVARVPASQRRDKIKKIVERR
jgi:hypothetical protein